MLAYAELHCWSNFTFLQGASHPEELVDCAAALDLRAVALTDRDGLYGSVRFSKAAKSAGLDALCGSELTMEDGSRLVLLVANQAGYAHLVELISGAQMRGAKRDARLRVEDLAARTDGLVALSGGSGGAIERAIIAGNPERAARSAAILRELFPGRFYIELQHHLRSEDANLVERMVQLAQRLNIPYVATNGVAYAMREDARLADVLTCIKHKTTLQKAGMLLRPNAEFYLKSPAVMSRIFCPYPQAVRNTVEIAERCTFRLDTLSGQFPTFPLPEGEASAQTYLRTLVYRGAKERYGMPFDSKVERQLEYELGIIARLDLAGYFLIVWDIVRAAAELNVLCQGRGSAANSAVCYALGITAVDPVGGGLLFERFLSEERREVPDIDIDFAHQDRERIIQYVYNRYGREHAAMAAEVITYRTRSALRDIGKALGLSLAQVDQVVREFDARDSLAGATECGPFTGTMAQRLFAFCRRIDGFPRHMGIHSGGMVITRDPLIRVAPVEWATMRDRTIVQWDKDDLGDLGLIKIDLLGLGMLSLLREAFSIHKRVTMSDPNVMLSLSKQGDASKHALRQAQGDTEAEGEKRELSLQTIMPDDKATYSMLQKADSIGVFQIESRAQQSMLPRLKPHCFYDLVMQVAIIRPGPIQGDMIHPFLRRRNGLEAVTYPHPKLKPILERTLGVPLFQEQGMRMAIEAAGFSPGQADQLRRAMGHKRSHERMANI
nr:DNA polymerase III subunit alpha [Candidatus Eremiobacteraeota bacterium]